MAEGKEQVWSEAPQWDCRLPEKDPEKEITVGDRLILTCSGYDEIASGGTYELKLLPEQDYFLKILAVKKDNPTLKKFEVTPYKAGQGSLPVIFLREGEEAFQSLVYDLDVATVIKSKKDMKAVPPDMGIFIYNSVYVGGYSIPVELVGGFLILVAIIILSIRASIKRVKKAGEYRSVVAQSKYDDPFMDLNLEIRDLQNTASPQKFIDDFDKILKKFLFRVFSENITIKDKAEIVKKLKSFKMPAHEIRAFFVFEEEYRIFKLNHLNSEKRALLSKKDFVDQAKKSLNKLKKYVRKREDV